MDENSFKSAYEKKERYPTSAQPVSTYTLYLKHAHLMQGTAVARH